MRLRHDLAPSAHDGHSGALIDRVVLRESIAARRNPMPFFPSLPEDATTKQIFAAHPEIYSHWVRVSEAILRGPSSLTPAQRELIRAYVSADQASFTERGRKHVEMGYVAQYEAAAKSIR